MIVKKYNQLFENKKDSLLNISVNKLIENKDIATVVLLFENNIIKDKDLLNDLLYNFFEFWEFNKGVENDYILKFLKYILKNGGDVDLIDGSGYSVIMNASYIAHEMCDIVLKYNPDLVYKNPNNEDYDVFDMDEQLNIEHIKNKYSEQYDKYLREKQAKKFKI